ncbi:MAG TPA: TolC family protein [Gemmatimonadales bacterium]|nr:TolC family protein [Gemmatimonadales bacterium]
MKSLLFTVLPFLIVACVGTPSVQGVAGTAPGPAEPWVPPLALTQRNAADTVTQQVLLPADIAERASHLTLTELIDIGLQNNTATRQSWAQARAAAATYGSARGEWLPTLDADVNASRLKTTASQGRTAVKQSVFAPSLSLSWLLLDFGGRNGRVGSAREQLVSADFTHNAVLQSAVLQIEVSYFQYVATRALLEAQATSLKEAQANLAAAEERRRVGLATVADVLQAKTALSQAQLTMQSTEGTLATTRGALALALGLPANVPYDVDTTAADVPVAVLADSVQQLINAAVAGRPDLAAARADAEAAAARVSDARSALLPELRLSGNAGRTYATSIPNGSDNYTVSLGLSIPIFSGFSRRYDLKSAQYSAEAARAQAAGLRQQVIFEVFSSYYSLQTATRRVHTADDLLASAEQSTQVALARYKEGVGTVLDLLAAQSALADARAQRIQARLEWNVSLAQLAHDAGVLDTQGGSSLRLIQDSTPSAPGND